MGLNKVALQHRKEYSQPGHLSTGIHKKIQCPTTLRQHSQATSKQLAKNIILSQWMARSRNSAFLPATNRLFRLIVLRVNANHWTCWLTATTKIFPLVRKIEVVEKTPLRFFAVSYRELFSLLSPPWGTKVIFANFPMTQWSVPHHCTTDTKMPRQNSPASWATWIINAV